MAGANGSRRFVKLWWVLAFVAGIPAGALSVTLFGLPETLWGVASVGLPLVGTIAALEWFGGRRQKSRSVRAQWRLTPRPNVQPARKPTKGRPSPRRGQLHAITGHKSVDPPSSSSS